MRKKTDKLSSSQVADYLLRNPGFLLEHSDLLADLQLPSQSGVAISLQERQARAMRERNTELRQRLSQLTAIARDNERLFAGIRALGLAILEADTLSQLAKSLHGTLTREFGSHCMHLFLYAHTDTSLQGMAATAYLSVVPDERIEDFPAGLLSSGKVTCAALRHDELTQLFPGYTEREGSAAVIPLRQARSLGFLAIGHHDPAHYSAELGTVFLEYLGEALSRRLLHLTPARQANEMSD